MTKIRNSKLKTKRGFKSGIFKDLVSVIGY
jgi:hypothetical protein